MAIPTTVHFYLRKEVEKDDIFLFLFALFFYQRKARRLYAKNPAIALSVIPSTPLPNFERFKKNLRGICFSQ